jgi:hypothetical protein
VAREEEEEAAAARASKKVSKTSEASEVQVKLSPSANRVSLLLTQNFNKDSPQPQVNSLLRSAGFPSVNLPDEGSMSVSPLSKDRTLVRQRAQYLLTALLKRQLLPLFPGIATDVVNNLSTPQEHSPRPKPGTDKLISAHMRLPHMPLFLKRDGLPSAATTLTLPRPRPNDSPPFYKHRGSSAPIPAPSGAISSASCTVIASTNFTAAEAPPWLPRSLVDNSAAPTTETSAESRASLPATPLFARP